MAAWLEGLFKVLCPKFNVTLVSGATSNLKHSTLNSPELPNAAHYTLPNAS